MTNTHQTHVHSTAVIGDGVRLGSGVTVGPHAVLLGPCEVGDRVWIGAGAIIGAPPELTSAHQNRAWDSDLEHAGVVIYNDVTIRENVVIHQGTHRPTRVGPESWILNRAYLAHDVVLGSSVTVSAGVSIGGHCTIGNFANLGMNSSVHQRRLIGDGAMIGMGTPVTRDLPPFTQAYGSPVRLRAVNRIGMQRHGFKASDIDLLEDAYRSGKLDLKGVHVGHPELEASLREWEQNAPSRIVQADLPLAPEMTHHEHP